ncbi:MAG: copper resistance protein CopC [Burkholderiales bacterium]|nr:copper resistance protein CopC [Burkholderiales bacterium]
MEIVRTTARWLALLLAGSVLGATVALGHSGLQRAEPPAGSTLQRAPKEVKLYFSERLEPAYSKVRVEDSRGARVDRNDSHVDPANPFLLRVTLSPLAHGEYTVVWRVLSVDSHITENRFTFRVE